MGSMTEPTRRRGYAKAPGRTQTDACGDSVHVCKGVHSDVSAGVG